MITIHFEEGYGNGPPPTNTVAKSTAILANNSRRIVSSRSDIMQRVLFPGLFLVGTITVSIILIIIPRQNDSIDLPKIENQRTLEYQHYEQQQQRKQHEFTHNTMNSANTSINNTVYYKKEKDIRIVGGAVVTKNSNYNTTSNNPNQYPFHVIPVGQRLCGGTLIAEDIVLTAAHCSGLFQVAGALIGGGILLDGSDSLFSPVDFEIQHPNYTMGDEFNDIMLVKLSQPISQLPITSIISIPSIVELNYDDTIPPTTDATSPTIATVIGFGLQREDATSFSNNLLETNIHLFNYSYCNAIYGNTLYSESTILCAGTESGQNDTCYGDSGGPLLIPKSDATNQSNNQWIQIGIVSFGEGCGRPNVPAVYTRVSAYQEWITSTICNISAVPPLSCFTNQSTILPTPSNPDETIGPTNALTTTITTPPSAIPIIQTSAPTIIPFVTVIPATTSIPTARRTFVPSTLAPFYTPTIAPITVAPFNIPSSVPSLLPTNNPTIVPSVIPSKMPTIIPTSFPSIDPSYKPTSINISSQSPVPIAVPTNKPTLSFKPSEMLTLQTIAVSSPICITQAPSLTVPSSPAIEKPNRHSNNKKSKYTDDYYYYDDNADDDHDGDGDDSTGVEPSPSSSPLSSMNPSYEPSTVPSDYRSDKPSLVAPSMSPTTTNTRTVLPTRNNSIPVKKKKKWESSDNSKKIQKSGDEYASYRIGSKVDVDSVKTSDNVSADRKQIRNNDNTTSSNQNDNTKNIFIRNNMGQYLELHPKNR